MAEPAPAPARRDLFGQQPVYWTAEPPHRAATSLWTLLRDPALPRALAPDAVAVFLACALAPDRSLFRGIHRLPPAHELRNGQAQRYETLPEPGMELDEGRARERLLALLRQAVRERLDARTACALSGGIDSATVLALACEARPGVRAYTVEGDFADPDELARARLVAARVGAEHVTLRISEEELPDHLEEAVLACETPLINGRAVASLLFYRRLRAAGGEAVLSGAGADEVLAGNPASLASFESRQVEEGRVGRSLLRPDVAARTPEPRPPPSPAGAGALAGQRRRFIETVLPDLTLPPELRASRVSRVEVRLPFLAPDFARFALGLPLELLARRGTGKWLLREAVGGLVPDELRFLPKAPRLSRVGAGSAAREKWLALYDLWLAPERLAPLEVIDPARVRALFDSYRALPPDDARLGLFDGVLMKLTSLSILQARLETPARWPESS